jgi:hypothetical protein
VDEAERPPFVVACLVRVREPSPDRERDVERHFGGHRLASRRRRARDLRARRPLDEFHRHVELALFFAEVEHLHEVRMRQMRAQASFVDEHGDELGIGGELRKDAFDRDPLGETVRSFSTGDVDFGHTPGSELL